MSSEVTQSSLSLSSAALDMPAEVELGVLARRLEGPKCPKVSALIGRVDANEIPVGGKVRGGLNVVWKGCHVGAQERLEVIDAVGPRAVA